MVADGRGRHNHRGGCDVLGAGGRDRAVVGRFYFAAGNSLNLHKFLKLNLIYRISLLEELMLAEILNLVYQGCVWGSVIRL